MQSATLRLRAREAQAAAFVPVMVAPPPPISCSFTVELRGGRKLHLPLAMPMDHVITLLRGLEASEVSP